MHTINKYKKCTQKEAILCVEIDKYNQKYNWFKDDSIWTEGK